MSKTGKLFDGNGQSGPNWAAQMALASAHGGTPPELHLALVCGSRATRNLVSKAILDEARSWLLKVHPTIRSMISTSPMPHVVLFELPKAPADGIAEIRLLKAAAPNLPVLVLCASIDRSGLYQLMAAGASGCLVQPIDPMEIAGAVLRAVVGVQILSSSARALLLGCMSPSSGEKAGNGSLTEAERQYLFFAKWGFKQKDIAQAMGVSLRTADTHRTNLCRKLGVRGRAEAVAKYYPQHR